MTVKLNNVAITALLESQQGPVGLLVQKKADEVLQNARVNAGRIMHRNPSVVNDIDTAPGDANSVVIGIRPSSTGRIAQYLADKAAGLIEPRSDELFEEGWLVAALRDFGS